MSTPPQSLRDELIRLDAPETAVSGLDLREPERSDPAVRDALDRFSSALADDPMLGDIGLVARAVLLSATAHDGVVRKSGEPYFVHPVEVAITLARMRLDAETIAAGLLHDVVEDTPVTSEDIAEAFGDRTARLVDGVTKLGQLKWASDRDGDAREKAQQAESLRKMFLAMVDDIGVVLIKLADRLHNMRTLEAMPRAKQIRTAQETMEIYAPLANRLGIWQVKSALEDLGFRYLQPEEYARITAEIEQRVQNSAEVIDVVMQELEDLTSGAGIRAEMSGRKKHIYSIYRKMNRKQRAFDEIFDVIGIRVIVPTQADCYAVFGIVHGRWHPVPNEFDDYIGNPKERGYQSLHTAVFGPNGHPVEIQIRTPEMHQVAEFGVAAHWRYKEGGKSDEKLEAKVSWLRQLMDWRDEVSDAEEFVESLKSDVFKDMVYVFTPAGDIIELPSGATPIDFAYRVHTQIGHQAVQAWANGQTVPLHYRLQNGQVVKIKTSSSVAGPRRDWLLAGNHYVTTASAREKIRQWFRRQERDGNIAEGKAQLERELKKLGIERKLEEVMALYPRYAKLDDFLAAIGYGGISSQNIVARLDATPREVFPTTPNLRAPSSPARVEVEGAGTMLTSQANCCRPVPGDPIVGYISRGRGLIYHHRACPNIVNLTDTDRLMQVSWGQVSEATYPVSLRISALDRVGLLKDMSALLAEDRVNILSVLTQTHDDRTVTLLLTVEVEGVAQLSRVINRLESVRDVLDVQRDKSAHQAWAS